MISFGHRICFLLFLLFCTRATLFSQDVVATVNVNDDRKVVSPYIYGWNNSFANSFGTTSFAEIRLFPNPVKESLSITFGSSTPALTDVFIYSQDGRLIDTFQYNYDGRTPIKMNTGKMDNGLYLMRIKNNSFSGVKKFTVFK